jgi:type 1 glutamine amidotransferase
MRFVIPLLITAACTGSPTAIDNGVAGADIRVLAFSKTTGHRHGSIPDAQRAMAAMADAEGWSFVATSGTEHFTDAGLAAFDVVIWLLTSGDVLNPTKQDAFERFVQAGGGYVGVHSASDTEYDWPWYGGLVGAYFDGHPHVQEARLMVEDGPHPATVELDDEWRRVDGRNPRNDVTVLLRLDEDSYEGGTMGDHPAAWSHEYDGGRAFYTLMGHTSESYEEALFRSMLRGAVQWAAGADTDNR